jgi:hypothetical protein
MKQIRTIAGVAFAFTIASSLGLGCVVHERSYSEAAPAPPPPAPPPPAPPPPAPVAAPATPAAPVAPPKPAPAAAHPFYLHALSDLRNARANLERKGGDRQMKWDEHDAIVAIDRAIRDLREASIDDGKNVDDHPPVDAHEPRIGRLHKALAALQSARADSAKEEDNGAATGLRARALHDIDEAIRFTDAGVQAAARES